MDHRDELIKTMEKLIEAQKQSLKSADEIIQLQNEAIKAQDEMIKNLKSISHVDQILEECRKYGTDF